LASGSDEPGSLTTPPLGHKSAITQLLAAGNVLVSGDSDGVVIVWSICQARQLRRLHGHIDTITSLSATSDGFLFATSVDATVTAWSWMDGTRLTSIGRHYHHVTGLAVGIRRKERVDVSSLIVSTHHAQAKQSATERWPGCVALKSLPEALECIVLTCGMDESIVTWALSYDDGTGAHSTSTHDVRE
jgi:WD40 repeat protein